MGGAGPPAAGRWVCLWVHACQSGGLGGSRSARCAACAAARRALLWPGSIETTLPGIQPTLHARLPRLPHLLQAAWSTTQRWPPPAITPTASSWGAWSHSQPAVGAAAPLGAAALWCTAAQRGSRPGATSPWPAHAWAGAAGLQSFQGARPQQKRGAHLGVAGRGGQIQRARPGYA